MNYTENINAKIKYLQNLTAVIKEIENIKSNYFTTPVYVTEENVEKLAKIAKNIRYNKSEDVYEYKYIWEDDCAFRLFDIWDKYLSIDFISEADAAGYLDEDKLQQLGIIDGILEGLTAKIK